MSTASVAPEDGVQPNSNERPSRSQGDGEQKAPEGNPEAMDVASPQESKENKADNKEEPAAASPTEAPDSAKPKRRRGRPRKSDQQATPKPATELKNGKRSAASTSGTSDGASADAGVAKKTKMAAKRKSDVAAADPYTLHKDKRDLGKLVAKDFQGHGIFTGEVIQVSLGVRPFWMIRYEDGDFEDLTEDDMRKCMELYDTLVAKAQETSGTRVVDEPSPANGEEAGEADSNKAEGAQPATATEDAAPSSEAAAAAPAPTVTTRSSESQKTPPPSAKRGRKPKARKSTGKKGKGKASADQEGDREKEKAEGRSLVGQGVRKSFDDLGDFDGMVAKYLAARTEDEEDLWFVKYTDGDSEHMDKEEVEAARNMYEEHYALLEKKVSLHVTPPAQIEKGDSAVAKENATAATPAAPKDKAGPSPQSKDKAGGPSSSKEKEKGGGSSPSKDKPANPASKEKPAGNPSPPEQSITVYMEKPAGSRLFATLAGYRAAKAAKARDKDD